MQRILLWLTQRQHQMRLLAALGLATALCLGLVVVRSGYFGRRGNTWLWWNLWLAWLPAIAAFVAYNLQMSKLRWRGFSVTLCSLFWLAFLPNAAYLITDVIHFRPVEGVPYWFDLILFVAFAWTGTFLGIISLLLMQDVVQRNFGRITSWLFALIVLALNSFGVYLGRFQRWNSWDVVTNPWRLMMDIATRLFHPGARLHTIAFTALFSMMFATFYLMILALRSWQPPTDNS